MIATVDTDLRRFSRVPFHATAQLMVQGRIVEVRLIDIALKGALPAAFLHWIFFSSAHQNIFIL